MTASPFPAEQAAEAFGVAEHRALPDDEAGLRRSIALVKKELPFVWNALRRLGLSVGDADDASQEVFVIAVKKIEQIALGQERRFLLTTAIRVAYRYRRSQTSRTKKTAEDVELDECEAPAAATDELVEQKRARALLDQILSEMTPDLRVAFSLFELEEMTLAEIAALLDIPIGTAASRLRRAREQFEAATKRRRNPPK